MLRIDGFYLYTIGYAIHPLTEISPGKDFVDSLPTLFWGQNALEEFFSKSVYSHSIRVSRKPAEDLYAVIKPFTENLERSEALSVYEVSQIRNAATKLEHVLAAEFGLMDMFIVSKKRGYDTSDLITNGSVLFPEELKNKVPLAKPDVEQGARCLAFELSTAAAFHFHRANESVLHRYYESVADGNPKPNGRNIGEYLRALDEKNLGDVKVRSALRDLKDLHRNPLIHPEDSLESIDEAIALLGSIHSVVVHMLKAIPMPEQPVIAATAKA